MENVSVIIPTFNRFKYLFNTIKSIKDQTYKNVEIIVINDCSTEKEYYEYNWREIDVIIIHLQKNSKEIFGFPCPGYVRNKGIEISSGKYIAFCDDDDSWFPNKLELQLNAMKKTNCKMCSTDGLIGKGVYNNNKKYSKYNAEYHLNTLKQIYINKGSNLLDKGFPEIWDLEFLKIHNCIITCSLLIEKEILNKINNLKCIPVANDYGDDYDCWLRALEHTNNVYLPEICFYYDDGHGYGKDAWL